MEGTCLMDCTGFGFGVEREGAAFMHEINMNGIRDGL
jgi:hypothetical protein